MGVGGRLCPPLGARGVLVYRFGGSAVRCDRPGTLSGPIDVWAGVVGAVC